MRWDRANIIILIDIALIIFLQGYHLFLEQTLSVQGIKLGELQDEVEKWQKENMLLREEVLNNESYAVIATKAAQIGYEPCNKCIIYKK